MNDMNETLDYSLLEKVNPVFQTAKMTLFQLSANGDPDAKLLVERMGLTRDQTQNSAHSVALPEQIKTSIIMMETRFRTMAALAEKTGGTLVDLPCGYTPRALAMARRGIPYYGLDLPVVIQEITEHMKALLPEDQQKLVHYRAVDATNHDSLEAALADVEGPVCILTEGLLMYFTDSEAAALCDNIRSILEKKGGCWYTADVETALQYVLTIRPLCGDRFMEVMKNAHQRTSDKADVNVGHNTLTVSPGDMPAGLQKAMQFLAQHGLRVERMPIADYMPELKTLADLPADQAAAIREGMKQCAYWKITVSGASQAVPLSSSETKGFRFDASIADGTLALDLTGRLDTITAPNLLSFFEETKKEHAPKAVTVDCAHLDYISSAGLRVMLIMHKACEDGVTLLHLNETTREILAQTGFDSILKIL